MKLSPFKHLDDIMKPRSNLHTWLLSAIIFSIPALSGAANQADQVEVFKSPFCGCCQKWVEHMRSNGFSVITQNVQDVPAQRKLLGMPDRFGSCHTAKLNNYVIEGHVPAKDIRRLILQKPKAIGLSAPGMPQGSPGMETATPMPYETLLIHSNSKYETFSKH